MWNEMSSILHLMILLLTYNYAVNNARMYTIYYHVHHSLSLCLSLSVCLCVSMSVCLYVCLSVCVRLCPRDWSISHPDLTTARNCATSSLTFWKW